MTRSRAALAAFTVLMALVVGAGTAAAGGAETAETTAAVTEPAPEPAATPVATVEPMPTPEVVPPEPVAPAEPPAPMTPPAPETEPVEPPAESGAEPAEEPDEESGAPAPAATPAPPPPTVETPPPVVETPPVEPVPPLAEAGPSAKPEHKPRAAAALEDRDPSDAVGRLKLGRTRLLADDPPDPCAAGNTCTTTCTIGTHAGAGGTCVVKECLGDDCTVTTVNIPDAAPPFKCRYPGYSCTWTTPTTCTIKPDGFGGVCVIGKWTVTCPPGEDCKGLESPKEIKVTGTHRPPPPDDGDDEDGDKNEDNATGGGNTGSGGSGGNSTGGGTGSGENGSGGGTGISTPGPSGPGATGDPTAPGGDDTADIDPEDVKELTKVVRNRARGDSATKGDVEKGRRTSASGSLPFTGLDLAVIVIGGLGLLLGGLGVRRLGRVS